MLKNRLKKFAAITISLVFLASCAAPKFTPPPQFNDTPVDWDKIATFRTIPSVEKMDEWMKKVHDAKPLEPRIIEYEGETYIAYTIDNHRELLKQLIHGRLGWAIAEDMRKQLESNQEVLKQVVTLAKLVELKSQMYRSLWVDSENKYLQLEYQVKIDNIVHKVTFGAFIVAILAFLALAP